MPPQMGLLNGFSQGLISLANYVKSHLSTVQTDILDLSTQPFELAKRIVEKRLPPPVGVRTVVGITTTTASYQSALQITRWVRQNAPHATIVLGGPHASTDPEVILRHHSDTVNAIVVGEGERVLCDLLQNQSHFGGVRGLAYLDENDKFVYSGDPVPLTQAELDAIPITYAKNGLVGTPGKFAHTTYVSARGCPRACAFCAVGNSRIRGRSIPVVIRDVETLLKMGFTRIAVEDNFFAHSYLRAEAICKAFAKIKSSRNGAFTWDCQTRVESLARKGTATLMAKAGCEAVYVGVESLNHEHLKYLNKTRTPAAYIRTLTDVVVPSLLDAGIGCYLNLQFGLPGETEQHGRTTCEVLASLGQLAVARGQTITVFPQLHVVYPGTEHFAQGIAAGWFPRDVFESFTRWEFHQAPVLHWLGEHFAHGTGGIPTGILKPQALRSGNFEHGEVVDSKAVLGISTALHKIDRIKGIRTFNYGEHIVADGR